MGRSSQTLCLLLAGTVGAACNTARSQVSVPASAPPGRPTSSATDTLPPLGSLARAAMVRSTEALLLGLPGDSATACVVIVQRAPTRHAPAPAPFLAELRRVPRWVVPSTTCPPTYAPPMMLLVDSLGRPIQGLERPAGYVDPYTVYVSHPVLRGDTLLVEARVRQGTSGHGYDCRVAPPLHATAHCIKTYLFMH